MDDVLSGVGSAAGSASGRTSSSQTKLEVDKLIKAVQSTSNSIENTAAHLEKMGDVFEEATDSFFKRHPDPFDERAPHSIFPECKLGRLQKGKQIFKNKNKEKSKN